MQADAFAHQIGGQYEALHHLTDAINGGYAREQWPALRLQECGQDGQDQATAKTDVGDEHQQAGDHAHRQPEVEPGQPQPQAVEHGEQHHYRELAAQEFGHHRVDVVDDAHRAFQPGAGHDAFEFDEDARPFLQQVEHHQRNEEQVGDEGQHCDATGLEVAQHDRHDVLRARPVVGDELAELGGFVLQFDPQSCLQQGRYLSVEHLHQIGQAAHQQHALAVHHRHQDEGERNQGQAQRDDHEQHREGARDAS